MIYIYIIQCTYNKYFVYRSKCNDLNLQYFKCNRCEWTNTYIPILIVDIINNCDMFDEDKYVKIYMKKYGIDNVRGGTYIDINLSQQSIIFLNKELNRCILKTIKCANCDQHGHQYSKCPNIYDYDLIDRDKCQTVLHNNYSYYSIDDSEYSGYDSYINETIDNSSLIKKNNNCISFFKSIFKNKNHI